MVNTVNTANVTKENNIEMILKHLDWKENTPEAQKNLIDKYSTGDLETAMKSCLEKEEYEKAAIIRDAIKQIEQSSIVSQQQEINEQKEENRKEQNQEAELLKKTELEDYQDQKNQIEEISTNENWTEKSPEEIWKTLEWLKLNIDELNKKSSENLNKILENKNSWNKEEVEKLKTEIKNLQDQKKRLIEKFNNYKVPDRDKVWDKFPKLKTSWIWFKLLSKRNIDGQTVLSGPQLIFRRNINSRRRLNKTIKMFNKIWNNPERAVRYILAKTKLKHSWALAERAKRWWHDLLNSTKFTMAKDKFEESFNKQKKIFIDDLFKNMEKNSLSSADRSTKVALEKRIDFYQKAFMQKKYWFDW